MSLMLYSPTESGAGIAALAISDGGHLFVSLSVNDYYLSAWHDFAR